MPLFAEHARLKDHVASMDGGLETKIQEGFVFPLPHHPFFATFHISPITSHHVSDAMQRRSSTLQVHVHMHI
jgi:hypothetical protein